MRLLRRRPQAAEPPYGASPLRLRTTLAFGAAAAGLWLAVYIVYIR